ncbi:MAG: YCF48-related protein, partial [Psychrosphaera sp.]|nr:YCF48-related protein [Psychrosphaera sp.]
TSQASFIQSLTHAQEQNAYLRLSQIRGNIWDLDKSGDKLLIATENGILHSLDQGLTWQVIEGTQAYDVFSITVSDDEKVWAVANDKNGTGHQVFLTSIDSAMTFQRNAYEAGAGTAFSHFMHFEEQTTIYDFNGNYFLTTDTQGDSWDKDTEITRTIDSLFCINHGFCLSISNSQPGKTDLAMHIDGSEGRIISSSFKQRITDLAFVVANGVYRSGFLTGEKGTLLKSNDSTSNWQPIVLPSSMTETPIIGDNYSPEYLSTMPDLNAIHLHDEKLIWIVGDSGAIYHSNDGGNYWVEQSLGTNTNLQRVLFFDANNGWVFGSKNAKAGAETVNVLYKTTDGGKSWQQMNRAPQAMEIFVESEQTINIVGSDSDLRATTVGSQWSVNTPTTNRQFTDLHFINNKMGWAIDDDGHVLKSTDGGNDWQLISNQMPADETTETTDFDSIFFINGEFGWMGAYLKGQAILYTTNGGVEWQPVYPKPRDSTIQASNLVPPVLSIAGGNNWRYNKINDIVFTTALNGWALVGESILRSTDGGETWDEAFHAPRTDGQEKLILSLSELNILDDNTIWVVGRHGQILRLKSAQTNWQLQPSVTKEHLHASFFTDNQTGWIVGNNNTLLHTNNGGDSWLQHPFPTDTAKDHFTNIHFSNNDSDKGWITNGYGVVLYTNDGGESWSRPSYNLESPLFSYIGFIFACLLLFPSIYLFRKKVSGETSSDHDIGKIAISDNAITSASQDKLGFNDLAMGLSRFLQNENTEPPMTMAITGDWGTGKSSLMGLIKHDLEKARFHPVWFNAWHHHEEAHLFGALMETIR